jgi:hypothetical protein
MLEAGFAVQGKTALDLISAGRAEEFVDNTGGVNAEKNIKVRRGIFKYNNDTTNPVTGGDLLKECFVLDDETVCMLATGTSKAGKVIRIDDSQVIVEII